MNYGKKSTAKKRTALISRSSMIHLTFLLFIICIFEIIAINGIIIS